MFNFFNKEYENISAQEVETQMKDSNTVIIDVREPYEYSSGHIPKAKLMPLGSLAQKVDDINKEKEIIVVCASGARSARAAGYLGKLGYNVKNMSGGMSMWRGSIKR